MSQKVNLLVELEGNLSTCMFAGFEILDIKGVKKVSVVDEVQE